MQDAPREGRGAARLREHCAAMARVTAEPCRSAHDRLVEELGPELAGRLVHALSGDKPLRLAAPWVPRLEVA